MTSTHLLCARSILFRLAAATCCACVWIAVVGGTGQSQSVLDADLAARLAQLDSNDWQVRANALYAILDLVVPGGLRGRTWMIPSGLGTLFDKDPSRKDQLSLSLIKLLARENATVHNARPGSLTEEYMNYWADLIGSVAALHDRRAVDVLLDDIGTGNLATSGVAALGPDVLDRVVALLKNGDTQRRMAAARTLAHMLEPENATNVQDVASHAKIKAGLIQASEDKLFVVRIVATEGLGRLGDPEVTAVLTHLAEGDPYSRSGDPGSPPVYPVREAAKRALAAQPPASKN